MTFKPVLANKMEYLRISVKPCKVDNFNYMVQWCHADGISFAHSSKRGFTNLQDAIKYVNSRWSYKLARNLK
jgi:hypothetical protein